MIKLGIAIVIFACALLCLCSCGTLTKREGAVTCTILCGEGGETTQLNHYDTDPAGVYHLLGKPTYE